MPIRIFHGLTIFSWSWFGIIQLNPFVTTKWETAGFPWIDESLIKLTHFGHFISSFQWQIGEITMISNSYIHLHLESTKVFLQGWLRLQPKIHILVVVVVVAATQAKENISSVSVMLASSAAVKAGFPMNVLEGLLSTLTFLWGKCWNKMFQTTYTIDIHKWSL